MPDVHERPNRAIRKECSGALFVAQMDYLCGQLVQVERQTSGFFHDSTGYAGAWAFDFWMFDAEINGEYGPACVAVKAVQTAYEACLTALKIAKKNRPKKTYEYINVISKERERNVAKIRAEYNTDLKLQKWITLAATRRALHSED